MEYLFWNHSKQHSSKTAKLKVLKDAEFWNHSKQHSSKTVAKYMIEALEFWNHSKQHSSKTEWYVNWLAGRVLEPFETTQL